MSTPGTGEPPEVPEASGSEGSESLEARLKALLQAARESGARARIEPLLEAFLREAAPDETASPESTGRFGMIGDSAPMRAVYDLIERVAPSDVSVLVTGETGTGKELVARALHDNSRRKDGPFLAENCAAVPANLLESELFGHVRGSFTGAIADSPGHFVAASGGTLFLDELGDMPLDMQAKLLRVLETREVRPVGASRTKPVDVRVVAATHRDLDTMIRERSFREDLAFRLNVVHIALPPLRDRPEDVATLAHTFLQRAAGSSPARLSEEALACLSAFAWPGNVRQLENEIQRAVALSGAIIRARDLSPEVGGKGSPESEAPRPESGGEDERPDKGS